MTERVPAIYDYAAIRRRERDLARQRTWFKHLAAAEAALPAYFTTFMASGEHLDLEQEFLPVLPPPLVDHEKLRALITAQNRKINNAFSFVSLHNCRCFIGVDLASEKDATATAIVERRRHDDGSLYYVLSECLRKP